MVLAYQQFILLFQRFLEEIKKALKFNLFLNLNSLCFLYTQYKLAQNTSNTQNRVLPSYWNRPTYSFFIVFVFETGQSCSSLKPTNRFRSHISFLLCFFVVFRYISSFYFLFLGFMQLGIFCFRSLMIWF
jgi:hypothetical protein